MVFGKILDKWLGIPIPAGTCRCCSRPYFQKDSKWGERGLCVDCWEMIYLITGIMLLYIQKREGVCVPMERYVLEGVKKEIVEIRNDLFAEKRRLEGGNDEG
jgi:hypothetical protein